MAKTKRKLPCKYCGVGKFTRGLPNHETACKALTEAQAYTAAGYASSGSSEPNSEEGSKASDDGEPLDDLPDNDVYFDDEPLQPMASPKSSSESEDSNESLEEPRFLLDDFKTEYHPASGRATEIAHFEDFGKEEPKYSDAVDEEPWLPFRTRLDFEVAELMLAAGMNNSHIRTLLSLLNRVKADRDAFTISNLIDLQKLWELSAQKRTNFKVVKITIPYKKEETEVELHYRPLWDWALDLVKDPRLAPFFEWDARRVFKYDGAKFIRFIDDPFSADAIWKIQTKLPRDGHPLAFILYADKNKLSSFGTQKGYPVIARLANIKDHVLRNGSGIGGGCVVGWIEVIQTEAGRSGTTSFANYKTVVWHESFRILLETIRKLSKHGSNVQCGDEVWRWLFPLILILAADFEEQCVMALIRGLKGLCPCPRCLVPNDELSDLSTHHPKRSAKATNKVMSEVDACKTQAAKEVLLKSQGLRPCQIKNAFLDIQNSDPYLALSFDDLHTDELGIWGTHMFSQLKEHISALPRQNAVAVDAMMDLIPRWRNLNHFKTVMTITFNDGSKHRDIAKQFLFASHNVLTSQGDNAGYTLLRCLRAYLNMTMYAQLDVQTTDTIASGREWVLNFSRLIQEYETMTDETEREKSWNLVKMHLHDHLFDDIQQKGTLRNLSTKPSEQMHGPLRKIYLRQTNFKDVGHQILRINHLLLIALSVREQMDDSDERAVRAAIGGGDASDDEDGHDGVPKNLESFDQNGQFSLGAKKPSQTIKTIMAENQGSDDYIRFHLRLSDALTLSFSAHNIPLPNNKPIKIPRDHEVTPYQFLKINYESLVDWKKSTDFLRCNPMFFGHARRDYVLVNSNPAPIFGQLLFVFACEIAGTRYPMALIQPYEVVAMDKRLRKDRDLGFIRARKGGQTEFISIRSIIRGAVLVPIDANGSTDRYVFDVLDPEFSLRMRKIFPGCTDIPIPS